ncbi:MAG: LysR substrate-binding domain-containing protein [Pseudomonadota bacterium]|nr:LysR substrate-binding domain-containing protein [Pseudomonadota bacterium]MEC8294537.1 LysR substrate-binding domain-containing protein [Pseudomonadota bacterium]
MDTEALRLFVRAADKRNISAAGRDLGLAPAVASARLAKLEKSIGADLLHRSTRKVALSQEGEAFLPYARDIIAREDAARAALGQGQAEVTGTLRFTAPSTFAQLYILPILPQFLADHPGLRLDLHLSDQQVDLIEGSFDLALRNAPLKDSSLRGRKLAPDQRVLCAAPDYLARCGWPETLADLADHDLIAFGRNSPRRLVSPTEGGADEVAMLDPMAENCRLVVDDGLSLKLATLAGAGIAANARWSVHQELRDGRLQQVLPDVQVDEDAALWLLYPKANVLSAKVRVFMDFLLTQIGRAPPWM